MLDNSDVGLSFADAAAEALTEEAASVDSPASEDVVSESEVSQVEQPTVEETENESIFQTLRQPNEDERNNGTVSDSTQISFNGEQITIGELKNGYLRQSDATKKWQEVAELRKEAESALALWDAIQKDPINTLDRLYANYRQTGRPAVESINKAPTPIDTDIDALVEQKVQALLDNESTLKRLKYENALKALDTVFSDIESEYDLKLSESDREFVITKAREQGTNDLKYVFWQLYQQASKKMKERDNARANSTSSGFRGDADTPVETRDEVPESFEEAFRAAQRDLKLEEIL